MKPSDKGAIYALAEETAYSSKGHFKTADWMGMSVGFYIFIPLLTSVILMLFHFSDLGQRVTSFIGFIFSLFALLSFWANNREKCDQAIKKHHDLANRYLELHKQIRNKILSGQQVESGEVQTFQSAASLLDKESTDYSISLAARIWSRLVINYEMDLKWIYR